MSFVNSHQLLNVGHGYMEIHYTIFTSFVYVLTFSIIKRKKL